MAWSCLRCQLTLLSASGNAPKQTRDLAPSKAPSGARVRDGHIVLDAEAKGGIIVERSLLGGIDVRSFQANRFVPVRLGQLDAAIPVAMLNVAAAENDEPGLQLLEVEKEGYGWTPVQVLWRVRA